MNKSLHSSRLSFFAKTMTTAITIGCMTILCGITGTVYAQTWSPGGSTLQTSPINTFVGIGAVPLDKLHIADPLAPCIRLSADGSGYNMIGQLGLSVTGQQYSRFGSQGDVVLTNGLNHGHDIVISAHTADGVVRIGNGQTDSEKMTILEQNSHAIIDIKNSTQQAPIKNTLIRMYTADQPKLPQYESSLLPGTTYWKIGLNAQEQNAFRIEPNINPSSFNGEFTNRTLTIFPDGKVSIGAKLPTNTYTDYKLSVDGKLLTKEIVVTMTDWADFVFDDTYRLLPLSELEKHIRENKHLPGIPSASQVEESGVNLGDMQKKLLQKIEELTLYVIELKKENENLQDRISTVEHQGSGEHNEPKH